MTRLVPTIVVAIVLILALAPASRAQDWTPPEPSAAERDWIMLTSGEWLWGDITYFVDQKLYFDSEELDDLTLDWDDVALIRSARVLTYTFTGERVATGPAVMQESTIRIESSAGVFSFPRDELIKIIEGDVREINFWSAKASVGLTERAGNTDQTDLNTVVKIRRDATRTRVDLDYIGNFSRVDTAQTVNNTRLSGGWNVIITRGFFVSPVLGELYQDKFQNIDLRGTVGAGLGWWILRGGAFEWNLQAAATYRETHYVSVEAGQNSKDETGAIVPATVVEWDITGDVELDLEYNAQIGVPDPKNTVHHMQAYLSMDLFGDIIDLTANFTWDRVESPKANADGITPERDDVRLALGLGIDL